jgi:hypothetical protein
MSKVRNKNRLNRQQQDEARRRPSKNAQPSGPRPEQRQHDPQHHRVRSWLSTANKAVLGALGAGILAIISGAVVGLPHVVANKVLGSPPPLTVGGGPSGNSTATADPCSLQGYFVVPGTLHPPGTVSTGQLVTLLGNAADADSTSGTYTLQANPGQTVVITAIHTIVIRRVPAPRATEVLVNSTCAGAAPEIYVLSINLDATNLMPRIQIEDPSEGGKLTTVNGLQTIVTNDTPLILNFEGDTSKYDVTWKLLIDYTVDGQSQTASIQNGSQPFHTIAGRRDDTGLTFILNDDQTSWTVQNGSPDQQ